ncbi:MAG: oxaloacetate decarboxylase [Pseudomonadales bacterium]|nr:oxaloacetate decarboxylase [Pseudomonadales bacterium]
MENLVSQGFELAIFGMGTVFVFLTLLILVTHGMSLLVQKYEPELPKTAAQTATQKVDRHLLAVITAAISEHRSKRD